MIAEVSDRHGVPVALCAPDGPTLASERDAADLIAEFFGSGVRLVAVPAQRFDAGFFKLRTGIAGAIVQKFGNYRLRLVILGDISAYLAASSTLRDFVAEANRGNQVWFLADLEELDARLARAAVR